MMKRRARDESGQGLVEMVLSMALFFSVLFMYVQISLGFAVANFFQYSTFIAARALLAGRATEADQKAAAQNVLSALVTRNGAERFPTIAKPNGGDGGGPGGGAGGDVPGAFIGATRRVHYGTNDARSTAWEQGVTYKFDLKLYMMPLIGGAKRGRANTVTLESQSWLGRDPSVQECVNALADRKAKSGLKGGQVYLYDNGC